MSEALNFADLIKGLEPTDVIRNEQVKERFIKKYNDIWGEGGENFYDRESMYFMKQMREKEDLRECTSFSVFYAFLELVTKNISLQPGAQALCYLLSRNTVIGTFVDKEGKKHNKYEKNCSLVVSGYGEIAIRTNMGQIKYADNPVVVYDGDKFAYGEREGHKYVEYTAKFPSTSNKIVACFLKIVRMNGDYDYYVMTERDWKRLESYSDKQNTYTDYRTGEVKKKGPNVLYRSNGGQIDTGFLIAKLVKHAFKTFPPIRLGNSQMESETYEKMDEEQIERAQETADVTSFGPEEQHTGVKFNMESSEQEHTDDAAVPAAEDDGAF